MVVRHYFPPLLHFHNPHLTLILTTGTAPWETPALFSIIEAVAQLMGTAGDRQLTARRFNNGNRSGSGGRLPKHALVYGNGGVFSASATVILGNRPL